MENIVKAKGFINKEGKTVLMIPADHHHPISEITGLLAALNNINQGESITLDDFPTQNSNNAVKSGGVYLRLSSLQEDLNLLNQNCLTVQPVEDESSYDFKTSETIDDIITDGIYPILYIPNTSNNYTITYHILVVKHGLKISYINHQPRTIYYIEQCIIDSTGIKTRTREETAGTWTEWENVDQGSNKYDEISNLINGTPNTENSSGLITLNGSVKEGSKTIAVRNGSHAEGINTIAFGEGAHAEGSVDGGELDEIVVSALTNHVTNYKVNFEALSSADIIQSIKPGDIIVYKYTRTAARVKSVIDEGSDWVTIELLDPIEIFHDPEDEESQKLYKAIYGAFGSSCHTEGYHTIASDIGAHAEGSYTKAIYESSHAEGAYTKADGDGAHAEGHATEATEEGAHAEGGKTKATNYYSHAEGEYTESNAEATHSEGYHTKANSDFQHVQGKYNIVDDQEEYAFIIGNGTAENARSNAFAIKWDGSIVVWNNGSKVTVTPADLAGLVSD